MAKDPFDDMSDDMFEEFDLQVDESDVQQGKVSKAAKNVTHLLKSTGSGAVKGVNNELRKRFRYTANVADEIIGTVDDFKKLKEDVTEELTPAINTMRQIALRVMPTVENVVPKSWYDKVKSKLEEGLLPPEESAEKKEEAYRAETIKTSLDSIFQNNVNVQQQMLQKQETDRLVDRRLGHVRFKASIQEMSKIDAGVSTINKFIAGTYTGYLKKSLELKYQGLFVMKDIQKAVVTIAKVTENRLEEIKHNTGLPEFVKIQALGSKGLPRAGAMATMGGLRPKTYEEFVRSYRSTMMGNISNGIMGSIKQLTRQYLPMMDMATSMMEMMGMPKYSITSIAAGLLGQGASWLARRYTGKALNQNGWLQDIVEGHMEHMPARIVNFLQKTGAKYRNHPLLGYFAEKLPQFNRQSIRNSMLEGANEAVPFDNTTRQTIVEVLPRHLERIGNFTEALYKKLASDVPLNKMTYNIYQRRLTTLDEARSDLFNRELRSVEDRATRMDRAMGAMQAIMLANNRTHKNSEKGKELIRRMSNFKEYLKRFIINSAYQAKFFEPSALIQFIESEGTISSDYISGTFEGIPKDVHLEFAKLLLEMVQDPKNGNRVNQVLSDRISNLIMDRTRDVSIQESFVKTAEGFGQSQLFEGVADYVNGIQSEGLFKLFNPKYERNRRVTINPETGKPYTEEEAREKGVLFEETPEESEEKYQEKRLRHMIAIETKLRNRSRKKGMQSGSIKDQMDEAGLGGIAHLMPEWLNRAASKVYGSIKKGYNRLKSDITGSNWFDAVTDKYNTTVKRIPEITSVERTGDTTYNLIAYDERYNKFVEKLTLPNALPFGTLPKQEIYEFATKKGWRFNPDKSGFSFIELESVDGKATPVPITPTESSSESPYHYTGGEQSITIGSYGGEQSIQLQQMPSQSSKRRPKATTPEELENEPIPFDRGTRRSIIYDIPDKLDDIIKILKKYFKKGPDGNPTKGGPKRPKPSSPKPGKLDPNLMGPNGFPADSPEGPRPRPGWSRKIGFDAVASLGDNTPPSSYANTIGSIVTLSNRSVEPRTTARKIGFDTSYSNQEVKQDTPPKPRTVRERVKDVTGKLIDTFPSKEELLSYIPQDMKDDVSKLYENCIAKKGTVGEFLTKFGTKIKASPAQKKILSQLKEVSTVIQDHATRSKYLGDVMSKLAHYKEIATNKEKGKEYLESIKTSMADKLTKIREDIEKKGLVGATKDTVKEKSQSLFRKLRAYWRLFRRTKVYKWISKHIPESAKKDLVSAWGDLKEGWELLKDPTGKKKVEEQKAAEQEAKAIKATQIEGSGDEGEMTPQEMYDSVMQEMAEEKSNTKTSPWERVKRLFQRKKTQVNADKKSTVNDNTTKAKNTTKTENATKTENTTVKETETKTKSKKVKGPSIMTRAKEVMTGNVPAMTFEGDPESLFHKDFRAYAISSLAAIKNISSFKSGGLAGLLLKGLGKAGAAVLGTYAKITIGIAKVYGGIAKSLLWTVGKIGPSIISGFSRIGAALVKATTSGLLHLLAKPLGWGLRGAKWLGTKAWSGMKKGWGGIKSGYGWLKNKWNSIGEKEEAEEEPQYYQDANGRWHGPDGKFVSEADVPDKFKKPKENLFKRITNRVLGFFFKPRFVDIYEKDKVTPGKPLLTAKQQEDEEAFYEDNEVVKRSDDINRPVFVKGEDGKPKCVITQEQIEHGLVDIENKPIASSKKSTFKEGLERRGFLGWAKTAVEWTKGVYGTIKDFFSKNKRERTEEEEQVPGLGKRLGIDLLLGRVTDIFNLLKEERDERKRKEEEAIKAAKDQANREASMSGAEQLAAAENGEESLGVPGTVAGAVEEGTPGGVSSKASEEDEGENSLLDDALDEGGDWLKSKAIKFARNKVAARGIKLLRKTKWGRRLLNSKGGKWALKGINKLLAKPGTLAKAGRVAGEAGGVLGKATGMLAKSGPLLSKSLSFAGKAAPWLALGAATYGGVKGFTASRKEDEAFAQSLGNEGLLERSFKTAINPVRQGRIITSTVRNTFGLGSDLAQLANNKVKEKNIVTKVDDKQIAQLQKWNASESDIIKYMEMYGKSDNDSLTGKSAIMNKYRKLHVKTPEQEETEKKAAAEEAKMNETKVVGVKTPSGITIPGEKLKEMVNGSDTIADLRSKVRKYVDENFSDKSTNARDAAVNIAVRSGWSQKQLAGEEKARAEAAERETYIPAGEPSTTSSTSASGEVRGGTLAPLPNETEEDYNKRYNEMKKHRPDLKSYYTEEGRKSYEAAAAIAKAMADTPEQGQSKGTSSTTDEATPSKSESPKMNETKVVGVKTPSGITIPGEKLKEMVNGSDTIADLRSKVRKYVDENFSDKSTNARDAAVNIAVRSGWSQKQLGESTSTTGETKTIARKADEATPSKSESPKMNGTFVSKGERKWKYTVKDGFLMPAPGELLASYDDRFDDIEPYHPGLKHYYLDRNETEESAGGTATTAGETTGQSGTAGVTPTTSETSTKSEEELDAEFGLTDRPRVGNQKATIKGGTLEPLPGESEEDYNKRYASLTKIRPSLKSYYTEEGKKSYHAAIAIAKAMGGDTARRPSTATTSFRPTRSEPVSTRASMQDEQAAKQAASSTTFVAQQQQAKSQPTTMQPGTNLGTTPNGDEPLLNATVAGNQSIGQKLDRLADLMGQQIVVTADSKVATEKMAAEGSAAALQTAMDYTNKMGKQVRQDMNRPAPRPAPISVMKTAYA